MARPMMIETIRQRLRQASGKPWVIFDLEYTSWSGSGAWGWSRPSEHREIVQIGAVLVDPGADLAELGWFNVLVRPQLNPLLSEHFTTVTGIRQDHVDAKGQDFQTAAQAFARFSAPSSVILANGDDGGVLLDNCRLLGLPPVIERDLFIDVRPMLIELFGYNSITLDSGRLARLVGAPSAGPDHDGLADARSVGAALRHFRRQQKF